MSADIRAANINAVNITTPSTRCTSLGLHIQAPGGVDPIVFDQATATYTASGDDPTEQRADLADGHEFSTDGILGLVIVDMSNVWTCRIKTLSTLCLLPPWASTLQSTNSVSVLLRMKIPPHRLLHGDQRGLILAHRLCLPTRMSPPHPPPNANTSVEDDAEVFLGSSGDEGAPSLKPLPAATCSFPHDDSTNDVTLDAQPSTLPPCIRRHKHAPHTDPDDGGHGESPFPRLRHRCGAKPHPTYPLASHLILPSTQPLRTQRCKHAPYPDPDEGCSEESPLPALQRKAASHAPADNESSDECVSTPSPPTSRHKSVRQSRNAPCSALLTPPNKSPLPLLRRKAAPHTPPLTTHPRMSARARPPPTPKRKSAHQSACAPRGAPLMLPPTAPKPACGKRVLVLLPASLPRPVLTAEVLWDLHTRPLAIPQHEAQLPDIYVHREPHPLCPNNGRGGMDYLILLDLDDKSVMEGLLLHGFQWAILQEKSFDPHSCIMFSHDHGMLDLDIADMVYIRDANCDGCAERDVRISVSFKVEALDRSLYQRCLDLQQRIIGLSMEAKPRAPMLIHEHDGMVRIGTTAFERDPRSHPIKHAPRAIPVTISVELQAGRLHALTAGNKTPFFHVRREYAALSAAIATRGLEQHGPLGLTKLFPECTDLMNSPLVSGKDNAGFTNQQHNSASLENCKKSVNQEATVKDISEIGPFGGTHTDTKDLLTGLSCLLSLSWLFEGVNPGRMAMVSLGITRRLAPFTVFYMCGLNVHAGTVPTFDDALAALIPEDNMRLLNILYMSTYVLGGDGPSALTSLSPLKLLQVSRDLGPHTVFPTAAHNTYACDGLSIMDADALAQYLVRELLLLAVGTILQVLRSVDLRVDRNLILSAFFYTNSEGKWVSLGVWLAGPGWVAQRLLEDLSLKSLGTQLQTAATDIQLAMKLSTLNPDLPVQVQKLNAAFEELQKHPFSPGAPQVVASTLLASAKIMQGTTLNQILGLFNRQRVMMVWTLAYEWFKHDVKLKLLELTPHGHRR
ncbi:hypothetical protein C8J57DRAFT_1516013 [Mycena rebaudengoi]|nr:hypothetical protein C8J57DRAFT_1516013 [Mycena rebaudengoi]